MAAIPDSTSTGEATTMSTPNIGTVVVAKIGKENREWGYNPVPDGTRGVIQGFGEIPYGRTNNFGHKPGIYTNKSWCDVLFEGKDETINISLFHLRDENGGYLNEGFFRDENEEPIRALPDTPFWEEDIVRYDGEECIVVSVDYRYDDARYNLSDKIPAGWGHSMVHPDLITLLRRGNVWKYYHDEPITFESLEDEANFFKRIGHTIEVRNPANNLYAWTLNEVLDAIEAGIADGFAVSHGIFGVGGLNHVAFKFVGHDDLAARTRTKTLAEFAEYRRTGKFSQPLGNF
jgi:hypothetical protein